MVLEDPHNLCSCYWDLGVVAPRLQIYSPGPHCHASLQGLPSLEVLPQGQIQAGTHRKGGRFGKRGCPQEAPTSLQVQGPPGARLSCLFAWLSPSGAEQSLPFDPWVVMRMHGWPRTLMSGHVVTWLRSPSRPRARLQGCRPQPGHTVSAPLLLLEGLPPPNPRARRTPIHPPTPMQTLPASPHSLPGC